MTIKLKYPLVLASGSARRKQLLTEAGYQFIATAPLFDEPTLPTDNNNHQMKADIWAEFLSFAKARSLAQRYPQAIIIGADTVVVHAGQIIEKPLDRNDAHRILSTMFAGKNDVITGLSVLCPCEQRCIITHVVSTLIMKPMNKTQLEKYLDTNIWKGKAGAYALQEGGDEFLQSMEGSPSNVVGLPMEKLNEILKFYKQA